MRFNDTSHLVHYVETGQFPAIHKKIAEMAINNVEGLSGLDLCCSHGLLGEQLITHGHYQMIGIDSDRKAKQAHDACNLKMNVIGAKIDHNFLGVLQALIYTNNIDFIVARRCLPELFGNNLDFGRKFFYLMREVGVKELVLEGRVATKKAVNALNGILLELALVNDSYQLQKINGSIAYLRAIK